MMHQDSGMENSTVMIGGEGPHSYFRNSKIQEQASDQARSLLIDGIVETLELHKELRVFSIADLGCSVGPNTFSCVKTIIEAVKHKYKSRDPEGKIPEFHVFFNDQVTNDFNTLFKALPCDRQYMAAGVPGSFHGRLFPESSINLMNSSMALHWLTKVPDGATERDSPLWNKGKITYARSSSQVTEAFRAQFFSDMNNFLNARSVELAPGGLLAILMPSRPQGTSPSEAIPIHIFECLADALADLVNEGIISEDLVESFNIPVFVPMASEMKEIVVSSNKNLSIEIMEEIYIPPRFKTPEDIQLSSSHVRAMVECMFSEHFGPKVVDELFNRYPKKLENFVKTSNLIHVDKMENLFLLLKRNYAS